jgi:elongator complex protein 1
MDSDAPSKINLICDLVRADLVTRDVFHYANTILTAHVRKRPPDYESALNVLASLKGIVSLFLLRIRDTDSTGL